MGRDGAPRFFDEAEIRARLSMRDLIESMERALVDFSAGRVEQPVRSVLGYGLDRSFFGLMPAYAPSLPALGAKLVTVCPGNAALGLDTHQAVIVMLDPATGMVKAVLDGRYITQLRTAAVSAGVGPAVGSLRRKGAGNSRFGSPGSQPSCCVTSGAGISGSAGLESDCGAFAAIRRGYWRTCDGKCRSSRARG